MTVGLKTLDESMVHALFSSESYGPSYIAPYLKQTNKQKTPTTSLTWRNSAKKNGQNITPKQPVNTQSGSTKH